MNNETKRPPINGMKLFDDLDKFQRELRNRTVGLPSSPAKELIDGALTAVVPLLAGLRKDFPLMLSAFQKQRELIESNIRTAKQNVAMAQENMAKLPPVDEIKKNLVPPAPILPPGLSATFADEMKSRYSRKPSDDIASPGQGTAWQDWSLSS